MKGAMKKIHRLKRVIAWLLTIAIISGNVSQLTVITAYAGEYTGRKTATSSNATQASPSEATSSQAKQVIDVKVTQSAIEKVLKKDFDNRPELKEDLIPFKGEQKDLVIEKIYQELEGKTLILQRKTGKAMYLVVVSDDLDGDPFTQTDESDRIKQESILQNVQIIGVNGYKDRQCEFRLRIISDDFVITEAQMDEYAVVGENAEDTVLQNSGNNASGGASAAGTTEGTQAETSGETVVETSGGVSAETQAAETESEIKEDNQNQGSETEAVKSTEKDTEAAETLGNEDEASKTDSDENKSDVKQEEAKPEREEQEKSQPQDDSNDSGDSVSGNDISISKNDIRCQKLSISRHQVPVLSAAQDSAATSSEALISAATPSQAVLNPENFDSADIVSIGDGRVLSSEEKSALMGIDVEEEEKGFSLLSLFVQPSFSMVVPSYGITLLNMEVSDEAKLSPYETALSYYGENATDKKDTVEIDVDQSATGEIKAGELFSYTITYTMQPAPIYDYTTNGKLSLFDTYENAVIYFTVPAGIVLETQVGKVQLKSSDNNKNVYEIQVGDEKHSIKTAVSNKITINAYIDGNGRRAVGESFSLQEKSLAFYADVKVADKTDENNIKYPGNIKTITYAKQPLDTQLQLKSDDEWHIKKTVYKPYAIIKDNKGNPQYIDITYLIEVGMYANHGEISRDPGGTIYQTYGRTGFVENSFHIKDTLSITMPNAPAGMRPESVSATWGDGKSIPVKKDGDSSIVISDYKTQGQSGDDHINVSDLAPTYSFYMVTARYPYEPFVLNYNHPDVNNPEVFTVLNQAHLEYKKLGTDQLMTDDSSVEVRIHEANKPAVIKISKMLDEDIGNPDPYNLSMEKEYPGYAEFEIFSVGSNGDLTPYNNFTIVDPDNKVLEGNRIVVNPSSETGEGTLYTTGDSGYIQIQADPGTYVIKEVHEPAGTEYSRAKVDSIDSQEIRLTIKAGEEKEVQVINNVVGMGAINFYKKARVWNSADEGKTDLVPLEGAEFTLYERDNDTNTLKEVKKVKSDGTGLVQFKPVKPGKYIVRETSAGGYVIDSADYPVTVNKGEISVLNENNYLVNDLNEAKVRVTKLLQKDNGEYDKVPEQYIGDFSGHFWFEETTDGGASWSMVSEKGTYSLGILNSSFEATLPVYDDQKNEIQYRVVEELPKGYTVSKNQEEGITTQNKDKTTYLYKQLKLAPLEIVSVNIKNDREGTLNLQKKIFTIKNEDNKPIIKNSIPDKKYYFKLYTLDKTQGGYSEVSPELIYETNKEGKIKAENLDISKQYYWGEVDCTDFLEAENEDKNIGRVVINGEKVSLIGPFTVSRQSDNNVTAYNVSPKVPFWIYKKDITGEKENISAFFKITNMDKQEVIGYSEEISSSGKLFILDANTKYSVEEISAPVNFVKRDTYEFTTPSVTITRKMLQNWIFNPIDISRIINNDPYKLVNVKKTQYNAQGNPNDKINVSFDIYQQSDRGFNYISRISSNVDTPLAPGAYYFKEKLNGDVINPLFLLPIKADGVYEGYIIHEQEVYYGPINVESAKSKNSLKMEINLEKNGNNEEPLKNYLNRGSVLVKKQDSLTGKSIKDAELGIFLEKDFNPADWENSIKKTPIIKVASNENGEAFFDSADLKIFDESGNRIRYVIAEINAPSNYLLSHEILTTTLMEGKTISTVNGKLGPDLVIKDDPKLTIRTQKYWRDSWSDQFYEVNKGLNIWDDKFYWVNRALGNVKLALYKVNENPAGTADLVKVQETDQFDGVATFKDIEWNNTYYIAEVRVPTKEESNLPFDLDMPIDINGIKKVPLPLTADGQLETRLNVEELKNRYNAVIFNGKGLQSSEDSLVKNTDPLFNYRTWTQFNILKICDKETPAGEAHKVAHQVNGARFTLYKMLDNTKNLSNVKLDDLSDQARFEEEGQYESGTRINPATGEQLEGQFDTSILEYGYVYWLKEDKAAPGYSLDEKGEIAAVFVPEDFEYSGYKDIRHSYKRGRNEHIAEIINKHSNVSGLENYHFQVALSKWLKDESTGKEPTLLGGVKFKVWLLDPKNNEKFLPIDVMETGLESDDNHRTGYALSKTIRLDELSDIISKENKNPDDYIQYDKKGEVIKLSLGLEEIYAPSKIVMDTELHLLEVEVHKDSNIIFKKYFWDGSNETIKLINEVSNEYPVVIKKYGYTPDSSTFYKTDDELDHLDINKKPLAGVEFEIYRYQWDKTGYVYNYHGTYTTNNNGQVEIPGGLPSGLYRMKEKLTTEQEKQYIIMYTGKGDFWRYFTVASSSLSVPVYNPQKPSLEIEKTTWAKEPYDLSNIKFTVKKPTEQISVYTEKQADDRFVAVLKELEGGKYTITGETLGTDTKTVVASNYFKTTNVFVGYKPQVKDNKVILVPVDKSVTGQKAVLTIKNPRLSNLTLHKEDSEDAESNNSMAGASFSLEYMKFETKDFDGDKLKAVEDLSYTRPSGRFLPLGETLSDEGKGVYVLKNCQPGWYRITETKAPAGYTVDTTPLVVPVTGDMTGIYKDTEVTFKNRMKVTLTITKKLNFGEGFKNDQDLEAKLPSQVVFDVFTSADGQKTFNPVYNEENQPVTVTINDFRKAENGYYTAEGTAKLAQNPEGGAYYVKERENPDWMLTDGTGVMNGTLLPSGYIKLDTASNFATKEPVNVEVENQYAKARIRITKVDAADHLNKLTGAAFSLYSDHGLSTHVGDFKEIGTSGVYEILLSTKVNSPDTYYVKETNAPLGYLITGTAIPEEGLTVKTGETTEIAVENQGGIDFQITKYSGDGKTEGVKEGITFELYKNEDGSTWNYVTEGTTDAQGGLSFRGLKQEAGYSYGLYEVPVKENGFDNFRLDSFVGKNGSIQPITADLLKNGETRPGLELYVLSGNDTKAPGVYRFTAHNQEALPLKLVKKDINNLDNPTGAMNAFIKVTKNGEQVGNILTVPYGETGTTVKLLPGIYELEEVSISSNSDGYVINLDDKRTVYKKNVIIDKGIIPVPCEFINVKQKTGVTLGKTAQTASIKDLWWNGGQTVTYTLIPGAVNTLPLDQYEVTDQGLTMLDEWKNALDEQDYSNEKYTILSVKPEKAAQVNQLREGNTGTIFADVTFYGFDGSQVGEVQTISVSGDGEIGEIKPVSSSKVKSFKISYRDSELKESTKNHYVLGQDFVPGAITVKAMLDSQEAILADGSYKKDIKFIRNNARVSMKYRKWDINGKLNPGQDTSQADAQCDISVVQSKAPVLSVHKNVDLASGVQIDDILTYKLTVTNATTSNEEDIASIKNPILIDLVPLGITVSGESAGENHLLKSIVLENAPSGVTINKTIRMVNKETGQETLFIRLNGELKKGETVTVSVKAKVAKNIINYGKDILNTLFVTSDVKQPAFSLNHTGASFMIGDQWPSNDLSPLVLLPDERYRSYGYASNSARSTMKAGTGIMPFKEVKGNLDSRYVSGTTAGRVAKSAEDTELTNSDGSVLYRLMVNNLSEQDYVSKLQVMDILPEIGDYSTGKFDRKSDYRLKFDRIESVQIENNKDTAESKRDVPYKILYSNQIFNNEVPVEAGKNAMLNNNKSDFWSENLSDSVTAFCIKIDDPDFNLAPGENLVVTYKAKVPYSTASDLEKYAYGYAVNDFSTAYSYKEGGISGKEKNFAHVQTSPSVQVLLVPGNVKVSGRIWMDDNNDGIQNESVAEDHLLNDLKPLLESGYFKVNLLKYSKYGDEQTSVDPGTGDARFLFDNLIPAKPYGLPDEDLMAREDEWYNGKSLRVTSLKGDDPAHYQIEVSERTMPKGYEDLVLKLSKPDRMPDGENKKAGRSRLPKTLLKGGVNYNESRDSNFTETKNGYFSEDFFLWSTAEEYDTTKDIGFVPYRKVTVKKINKAKNPVEGAHFSVYGPFTNQEMDSFKNTQITDLSVLKTPVAAGETILKDGEAVWDAGELLYYMNYIIVEDDAPEGYQIANAVSGDMTALDSYKVQGKKAWILKSKEFKTAADPVKSTVTVEDSYITGSLEFTKIDGLTKEKLNGAVFQIDKKSQVVNDAWNALIASMKKDADEMGISDVKETEKGVSFKITGGLVKISGIPLGRYTLSELQVPGGYDISKKLKDTGFEINSEGQEAELSEIEGNVIENTRTEYSLSIRKADNAGNNAVKGISFSISGPGRYASSTWNPFSRNKFKINDSDHSGYEVKQTSDEGIVTWNLPYGDYEITEPAAPGYQTIEPFFVRIGQDGTVSLLNEKDRPEIVLDSKDQKKINVVVTNKVLTAPLVIEKMDEESKQLLTGAWFELSGTSLVEGAFRKYLENVTGSGVSSITTRTEGGILSLNFRIDGEGDSKQGILTRIPYGTYTLKETQAPSGYLFGGDHGYTRNFDLKEPEGISLTGVEAVTNTPHELTIEKRDKSTNALLSNAEFVLVTAEGKYVSLDGSNSYTGLTDKKEEGSSFTTGSDGTVTVKRLPAGNYVLKEVKAPENYSVSADTEVYVLETGNTDRIKVYDERERAKIRINKAASHNHEMRLSGAVFDIYSEKELLTSKGSITTGNDGTGESQMLPLGTYYIKEKTAPTGYESGSRIYEVTLKADSEFSTVTADGSEFVFNDYGTGSLIFNKVDGVTEELLPSAEFSLTGKTNQVEGAFEDFTEKILKMSTEEYEAMGIRDVRKDGTGIRFTAFNGHVDIGRIPYGTYTLKEEKAPEGYLSLNSKAEFDFALSEDQKIAQLTDDNQVVNDRAQFVIKINKTDNLQRSISGISFHILGPGKYEDNGILSVFGASRFHTQQDAGSGTFVTGDDGSLSLGLKHGDYQIREDASDRYDSIEPFYIRVDEKGKVSILKDNSKVVSADNGSEVTLTVTNQISTGSLSLEKVDSEDTNKRLEGAEFTLTNLSTMVPGAWDSYRKLAASDGAAWTSENVIGSSITFTLSGKAVITNLPYGTYRITETKAPKGYLLGTQPWSNEFTLNQSEKSELYVKPSLFEKTKGAVENHPSKVTVVKTNAVYADTRLGGAEFIMKASGGSYVKLNNGSFDGYTATEKEASRFVTDGSGQYIIKRLPADTYTIIETRAPSGYKINSSIPPLTLDGVNSFTITIQDEKQRGDSGGDNGPTPGKPQSTVTIIPDPVPLANVPGDSQIDLITVDDGNVPLAKLPKTGERKSNAGKVMVALSGFMLALYAAINKKKKPDK